MGMCRRERGTVGLTWVLNSLAWLLVFYFVSHCSIPCWWTGGMFRKIWNKLRRILVQNGMIGWQTSNPQVKWQNYLFIFTTELPFGNAYYPLPRFKKIQLPSTLHMSTATVCIFIYVDYLKIANLQAHKRSYLQATYRKTSPMYSL